MELYSDSKYVIDALEKGWVWGWKKRGWVKSDKKPALNVDLWEQPAALIRDPSGTLPLGKGPRQQREKQPLRPAGRGGE